MEDWRQECDAPDFRFGVKSGSGKSSALSPVLGDKRTQAPPAVLLVILCNPLKKIEHLEPGRSDPVLLSPVTSCRRGRGLRPRALHIRSNHFKRNLRDNLTADSFSQPAF
jgi:hypothetical protein